MTYTLEELIGKPLKPQPEYKSDCVYFSRTRHGSAFCSLGNNKKIIGRTRRGIPYESYTARCMDCNKNNLLNI
ncbi:MAG: hypothetical protein V1858_02070 [Candidatus Gottesmanbacteria bacterium]